MNFILSLLICVSIATITFGLLSLVMNANFSREAGFALGVSLFVASMVARLFLDLGVVDYSFASVAAPWVLIMFSIACSMSAQEQPTTKER